MLKTILASLTGFESDRTVLDYGCGHGEDVTTYALKDFLHWDGTQSISPRAIRQAP